MLLFRHAAWLRRLFHFDADIFSDSIYFSAVAADIDAFALLLYAAPCRYA